MTIGANSLTESMCDGITRRLFKSVEMYSRDNGRPTSEFEGYPNIPGALFEYRVGLIACGPSGRRKKNELIIDEFCKIFFNTASHPSVPKPNLKKETEWRLYGINYHEGALFGNIACFDFKKPQKTINLCVPIGFTIHSVSRLIYRFKPSCIERALYMVAILLMNIITLSDESEGKTPLVAEPGYKKWVFVENLGGFLLAEHNGYYRIITTIDRDKMTDEQLECAKNQIDLLRDDPDRMEQFMELIALINGHSKQTTMSIPIYNH